MTIAERECNIMSDQFQISKVFAFYSKKKSSLDTGHEIQTFGDVYIFVLTIDCICKIQLHNLAILRMFWLLV